MMDHFSDSDNTLRRIKTARTEKAINAAAKIGLRPLVKPVKPSHEIQSKIRICQNKQTGEIAIQGDYRAIFDDSVWEVVVNWMFFYPHAWPSPFAAYLIPPDIKVDEIVILEDLIEDLVGSSWNQGDVYRLRSCKAKWTGNDFILDYDPERSQSFFVG